MTASPRIYVACLASYNNGTLHGAWVDVSDVDTMSDEIADILRASKYPNVTDSEGRPTAEEWVIHDHEGVGDCGEHPSLSALCDYVEAIEGMDDSELEAFADWRCNRCSDESDDAADMVEAFHDAYAGIHSSLEAFAESIADDTGLLDAMPENLRNYFDFEAYARDMRLGGDIWESRGASGDLHVFWNR